MPSTTGKTRDGAPHFAYARKLATAIWTKIDEATLAAVYRERKRMTARFAVDAEIAASLPPLRTVRQNSPPTGAKLGQQMRQFMP